MMQATTHFQDEDKKIPTTKSDKTDMAFKQATVYKNLLCMKK